MGWGVRTHVCPRISLLPRARAKEPLLTLSQSRTHPHYPHHYPDPLQELHPHPYLLLAWRRQELRHQRRQLRVGGEWGPLSGCPCVLACHHTDMSTIPSRPCSTEIRHGLEPDWTETNAPRRVFPAPDSSRRACSDAPAAIGMHHEVQPLETTYLPALHARCLPHRDLQMGSHLFDLGGEEWNPPKIFEYAQVRAGVHTRRYA